MARIFAGAAACFLFLTGAFLLWQGRAEEAPLLPAAPPSMATPSMIAPGAPQAPEASAKNREEIKILARRQGQERADRA